MFEGLEVLDNRDFYLVRGVPELIPAASPVGEDDSEKDGRLPSPILSKCVPQTHNIGAQHLLELVDGLVELGLLGKRLGKYTQPHCRAFWRARPPGIQASIQASAAIR